MIHPKVKASAWAGALVAAVTAAVAVLGPNAPGWLGAAAAAIAAFAAGYHTTDPNGAQDPEANCD